MIQSMIQLDSKISLIYFQNFSKKYPVKNICNGNISNQYRNKKN